MQKKMFGTRKNNLRNLGRQICGGGHVRPKRVKTRKSGAACITERIVSAVLILPGTVSVRDALISVATVRQDTREEVL